jgi:hypothetical protein
VKGGRVTSIQGNMPYDRRLTQRLYRFFRTDLCGGLIGRSTGDE